MDNYIQHDLPPFDEAMAIAIQVFPSFGVSTGDMYLPDENGEMQHVGMAGVVLIAAPNLAHPVACLLSVEMVDSMIEGLQELKDKNMVTWKAHTTSVVEDHRDNYGVN